jgi:tetratricopeptide (TPR) repeat protein
MKTKGCTSSKRGISRALVVFGVALACGETQKPPAHPAQGSRAPAASSSAPRATPLDIASEHLERSRYAEAERGFRAELAGKERVRAALGLAETLLATGRYADAGETARAVAGTSPEISARAASVEGRAFIRQGRLADAERVLRSVEGNEAAHEARLLLGEVLIELGRRKDAKKPLMALVEAYNAGRFGAEKTHELALVGRAAYLLRSPRDANDAYSEAEEGGAYDRQLLLWRAELFLEKYDPGKAEEVLRDVLERAPNDADALVWMAHVRLDQALDFEDAERLARKALAVNPKLAEAYFVLGGVALRDQELDLVEKHVTDGLAVRPGDLRLASLRAAARFVAADRKEFEAARREVLAKNPEYSQFYAIVGEYADWEHRYDEIVELMREAVNLDPDDPIALASLGVNLMRAGREKDSVTALSRAFSLDPFNVRVFNTLELFEKIVPKQYVSVAGTRFTIRYHEKDKPVLERYVPGLLERSWKKLVEHYGFTPETPVGIELYAERQHFAVRTSGLPETEIQGVCFGHTLAAMSPQRETFNLGMTLWHELAHVFHIQLSKSRVPRWFTEGLAEYETKLEKPGWTREHDPELFEMRRAGRLPSIESMNRAFTRAEQLSDMATAYYASSRLVEMLGEQHGMKRLAQMLKLWGDGKRTGEVFRGALGSPASDADRRFAELLDQRLARYRGKFVPQTRTGSLPEAREAVAKAPKSAEKHTLYALALLKTGDVAAAKAALAQALALDPRFADARFLDARLSFAEKRPEATIQRLEGMIADGQDGFAIRMLLAEAAEAAKRKDVYEASLQAAVDIDPTQVGPLLGLSAIAEERKDDDKMVALLKKIVALSEHDAGANRALLERLVARGEFEEAQSFGEDAIWVDMLGFETHYLFARALMGKGDFKRAEFELETALLCQAEPAEINEAKAKLDEVRTKLGKRGRR